jgi:hypothetical protein
MLAIAPEGDQEVLALTYYGQARAAAAYQHLDEARRLGAASLTILEGIGHCKAIEVKAWLQTMPE